MSLIKTEVIGMKYSEDHMVAKEIDRSWGPAWAKWYRCPLIPQVWWRTGNRQNTWSFGIHWLVFHAWTMDNPEIGASIALDDRQLEIRLRLPYLITGLFIPIFPERFAHKLWRKSKHIPSTSESKK